MVSIWCLCIVEADVIPARSFLSVVSLSFAYASGVLLMCHGRPESRDSVVVPIEQVWSDIDHGGEDWVRVNKRRQTRGQANSATENASRLMDEQRWNVAKAKAGRRKVRDGGQSRLHPNLGTVVALADDL